MHFKHPLEIPKSSKISFEWTSQRTACSVKGIHGDTHPMTWAVDDQMYMSAGDPNFAYLDGQFRHVPWSEANDNQELYQRIGGVDVERLTGYGENFGVEQINTMPGLIGGGGNGAKPSGMISVKGSLYLAVQNLLGSKPPANRPASQHATDATILRSDDFGKNWYPDIQTGLIEMEAQHYDRKGWKWRTKPEERTEWKGWKPMFPGALFGGPSFVQFGKDNSEALYAFVYAISSDQWDNGSNLRLGRVHQDRILDEKAWEWAVPNGNDTVVWVNRLEDSGPVLTLDGHLGLPEMVYIPNLKCYLLLTWGLHNDFNVDKGSELTILASQNPWGPFGLVYYEEIWDSIDICPYCPRIPLKWFNTTSLTGWLLHSGSWHTVDYYKPFVKSFRLIV